MMGGLDVDIDGATRIEEVAVEAAGEAACRQHQYHGANRLGANSTAECLVWGRINGSGGRALQQEAGCAAPVPRRGKACIGEEKHECFDGKDLPTGAGGDEPL